MAKIIDIKYPDNTIHNVICNRLYQVNVDGETLYVLEATDRTKGNSGAFIVLERVNGIFYKRPLGTNLDYQIFAQKINSLPKYAINVLELPSFIDINDKRKVNIPQSVYGSSSMPEIKTETLNLNPEPKRRTAQAIGELGPQPPKASASVTPPPNPPGRFGTVSSAPPAPPSPFTSGGASVPPSNSSTFSISKEERKPMLFTKVYKGEKNCFGSEYYIMPGGPDQLSGINFMAYKDYCRLRLFVKASSYMPITEAEYFSLVNPILCDKETNIKEMTIFISPNGTHFVSSSEVIGTPNRINPFKNYRPITKAEYAALKRCPDLRVGERLMNFPRQTLDVYHDAEKNTYYLVDYVWNSITSPGVAQASGKLIPITDSVTMELINGSYDVTIVPLPKNGYTGDSSPSHPGMK